MFTFAETYPGPPWKGLIIALMTALVIAGFALPARATVPEATRFAFDSFSRPMQGEPKNRTQRHSFLARLRPRRRAEAAPGRMNSELASLESLASFLRAHPDVPASHRGRFLDHLVAGCRAVRAAAKA